MVVRIVERVVGRYEVGETEFGRVYRWCPGGVVLECGCGERSVFTGSATTCGCGVNHAAIIQEGVDAERLGDEALRPWRYVGDREDAGVPY